MAAATAALFEVGKLVLTGGESMDFGNVVNAGLGYGSAAVFTQSVLKGGVDTFKEARRQRRGF